MLRRLACAALAAGAMFGACAGELVSLTPREGGTERYLIYPVPATPTPGWLVLLFAGGNGQVKLNDDGIGAQQGSFLMRTLLFWRNQGVRAVVLDAPSDQPLGMSDSFRLGDEHATDVAAVVADLRRRFPGARLALVGASRGTVSVGALLKRQPTLADAYVLISPVTVARGNAPGLSGTDFRGTRARVLVVSHREDACAVSPFALARRLAFAGRFAFYAVGGGEPPTSDPCEGMSKHGYIGQEQAVLMVVANWLAGGPVPAGVE